MDYGTEERAANAEGKTDQACQMIGGRKMKWRKCAAISAAAAVVVVVVVLVALTYPWASTIRKSVAKAGPADIVREADALMAEYPLNDWRSLPLPAAQWPQSIASLKPSQVYVRKEGLYIECGRLFAGGWGVFVPARGLMFFRRPGGDPGFEKLAERVFHYDAPG